MISEDKLQEITRRINEELKRSLQGIEINPEDIRGLIVEAAPREPGAVVETRGSAELLDILAELDEGTNQLEILDRLVVMLSRLARGSAVVIVGDPISTVWPGPGLGLEPGQQVGAKKVSLPLPEGSVVMRAAKEAAVIAVPFDESPDNAALYNALSQEPPAYIAAVPMAIQGKIQAVVLADSTAAGGPVADVEAMAIMVRYASMAIELLPSRERFGHLRIPVLAETVTAEAAPAPPEIEVVEEPEPEVEVVEEPEAPAPEVEVVEEPEAAAPEVEVVEEPEPAEPAVEVAEEPEAAAPEVEVIEEPEVAEEVTPGEVVEVAEPVISELKLEGYDLASLSEEERPLHEKAIRFARLLVSEIKLYNEETVIEGRQNADLMTRLKEEIDRSRSLYDKRIPAETREASDYFRDELLRQLAEGDQSLLGEK